ncbi:MAG: tRNA pseudouridine(55) synthase TruB [Acidobacteria bacterium]|nr:MAG: tRNA pseudouridine(55) synthase TruB [Acidobacteriota bacterium]
MDGILITDKPAGMTSHDVVNRVRRILKTKKVGHTGTLDPFATGVLVMLVGKATRLAQFVDKDEKEYEAVIRFGFETDTGDRTGSPKSKVQSPKSLRKEDIESVLRQFRGEIEQIPPMYSAKKVAGRKLYEHARKGVEIAREPVKITIRKLEIVDPTQIIEPFSEVRIRVVCSAGTYIRTLAEDIGRAVGVGAHLDALRRTRAGRFSIADATTLGDMEKSDDPTAFLLPLEEVVGHIKGFVLEETRVKKTIRGLSTRIDQDGFENGESVKMLAPNGEIVAIGIFDADESCIRPKIVLV